MDGNDTLQRLIRDDTTAHVSPQSRKNAGNFDEMREKLLANAYELRQMAEHDIPEALPLSPPKGGLDYDYNHSDFEMMFISTTTDIDDGTTAIELLQQELMLFEGLQFVLSSLFPTKTSNGVYELQINDQFQKALKTTEEAIGMLQHYLKQLNDGLSSYPSPSVNKEEMRHLKNHLIRLAMELYKTGEIPYELRNARSEGILSPERIAREHETIENAVTQIAVRQNANTILMSPPRQKNDAVAPEKDEMVSKAFSRIDFSTVFQKNGGYR